jgi:hypothetical protein
MTTHEIASKLLTYFSHEERSIPDSLTYPGRNDAVLDAINAGLQELFGKGKPWVRKDERGASVNAPTTVSIAVTNGSTEATIADEDWQDWFAGCTCILPGAAVDNQIRNAEAAVVLKFPYSGETGTVTATIYHDSVTIGTDVLEVIAPVRWDRWPIVPLASPTNIPDGVYQDYGSNYVKPNTGLVIESIADAAGVPRGYFVGTWSAYPNDTQGIRMKLAPAPAAAGFLDYQVMLAPPIIEDIDDTTLPIPFNFVHSIFLPIAVKRLSDCPFWSGILNQQQVEDAYKTALSLLADGSPNKTGGVRFITKG